MGTNVTQSARWLALLAVLSSLTTYAVAADGPVDARLARGRVLAEAHCSVCHAVGAVDASPTWVNSNTAFRLLHERYPIAMLVEAAKTGQISGHDEMPEFDFSLQDIDALLSYIDSLAPDRPGYADKFKTR